MMNVLFCSELVGNQVTHPAWGKFAQQIIADRPNPHNGNKLDQAHAPIHPTKLATNLQGNAQRVYELICRHFVTEKKVNVTVAKEKFTGTGLCIDKRNYLDVYNYEKLKLKEIHKYGIGNTFEPTK